MYRGRFVSVVIPAMNEAASIGEVIAQLKAVGCGGACIFDEIIVCDNGSTDATAELARAAGAQVVYEPRAGYGYACLCALKNISASSEIVLFIDADNAFYPAQSLALLAAIDQGADLVIGSRELGTQEKGALTPVQIFGNRFASMLIRLLWRAQITDLGPFRAIRTAQLARLDMRNQTFGWTVEMQVKAIQKGLRVHEVAVDCRQRIGISKISGTLRGSVCAGVGILGMIARCYFAR